MSTVTFDVLARDHASATFRRVGNETQTLTHHLDGLRAMARRVVTAIGLFEIGREVTNFGTASVKAYASAQTAQTQLTDAYQRFPALANVPIQALRRLNMALEQKTGADHNALAQGEAVLAQFNLTGRAIKTLVPYLNDYATKTGQDIPTAATGLGRSLLGNARALKSIGIEFKATGNQSKDATRLTQLLRDKLGGFADREGKTAQGQAKILAATFRDVKESLGHALLPSLLHVGQFLNNTAIPAMRSFVGLIRSHVLPAVESWGRSAEARLAPALRAVWGWIQHSLIPAVQSLAGFIIRDIIPAAVKFERTLVGGLVSAFRSVRGAIDSHRSGLASLIGGFKAVVDFIAHKVVPVFAVELKIQLEIAGHLLAGIVTVLGYVGDAFRAVAHFLSGPFVSAVGDMVSFFVRGVKGLADVWFGVVGAIVNGGAKAFGWLPFVGGKLKDAASAFNAFRGSIDATLAGIATDASGWGAAAGTNWGTNFAASVNPFLDPGHPGYKGPAAKHKVRAPAMGPVFNYDPTALGTSTGTAIGKGVAAGISKALDAAKQRMQQDFASIKSFLNSEKSSLLSTFGSLNTSPTTDSLGASGPAQGILSQLKADARKFDTFARLLGRLRRDGLDPRLLQQLEGLGPEGIPAMQQLLHQGRGAIRQANRLERQIARDATGVAVADTQAKFAGMMHHDLQTLPRKFAHEFAHELKGLHLDINLKEIDRRNGHRVASHT